MNKLNYNISGSTKLLFFYLFFSVLSLGLANAQAKKNKNYVSYIDTYNKIAVDHMKKHKIPASITLAQGLLESGAGMSTLATEGNNHFGIKCHNDWRGATMRKDDDFKNECFRKYKKAEESYHDHSMFLTQRSRYNFLFDLRINDYKGWAKGLQKAGYATDKAYANKLIKLIEDYELYRFDKGYKEKRPQTQTSSITYTHTPYKTHGLVYIVAEAGDSYQNIAKEFDFRVKDLYKYNEVPEDFPLAKGDIVYFQNKKKKADKPYYEHIVKVGESMHSISQRYGISVKNLYKMNKKDYEYVPEEGDILKLR